MDRKSFLKIAAGGAAAIAAAVIAPSAESEKEEITDEQAEKAAMAKLLSSMNIGNELHVGEKISFEPGKPVGGKFRIVMPDGKDWL